MNFRLSRPQCPNACPNVLASDSDGLNGTGNGTCTLVARVRAPITGTVSFVYLHVDGARRDWAIREGGCTKNGQLYVERREKQRRW